MKIKKYSKGKHTYTQWGKTKKIEQKINKPLIEYNNHINEFYSNDFDISFNANKFTLSFFKIFFPSRQKKIQGQFILHYNTAKQLAKDIEKDI